MTPSLTPELWYTALTALFTSVLWMPYVLYRIYVIGIWAAFKNPDIEARPKGNWAYRMANAHKNAVENLVVFAVLAIIVHISGLSNEMTALASMVFFASRVAHLFIYTLGIPVLRTLAFFAGFGCQMVLAMRILGLL